jgi:hypothetical protein
VKHIKHSKYYLFLLHKFTEILWNFGRFYVPLLKLWSVFVVNTWNVETWLETWLIFWILTMFLVMFPRFTYFPGLRHRKPTMVSIKTHKIYKTW